MNNLTYSTQKQLQEISCVFQGFGGVGAIYVSGILGAKNIPILQNNNIKAVVCAARSGFLQYDKSIIQDYLYVPADDYEQFDLSQYFQKTYHFIQKNRKKTNVLVHCMAGISRSASLVVAFLIKKYDYSMESILSLLKRKRSIINPNHGFLEQLISFQNSQKNIQSKPQPKKSHQNKTQRQSYYSTNKTITQHGKNKSIEICKKGQLSKQSKQFLRKVRQRQGSAASKNHPKRANYNADQILRMSSPNNCSTSKPKRTQFYSSQLQTSPNVVQVQLQINLPQKDMQELSETNLNSNYQEQAVEELDNALQIEVYSQLRDLPSHKQIQPPLLERLQLIKANLLIKYKQNLVKKQSQVVENEEQKQIDLALATKILKSSKPRRLNDKKYRQLTKKYEIGVQNNL